jgi:tetratricopeptide (TPR) repeat protein
MPNRARHRASIALLLCLPLIVWVAGCAQIEGARLYRNGTAALEGGDPERAIADLELAAERVPEASEIQNHLGLAYAAAGRDDAALQAFQRAVDLDCENRAAQQNLRAAVRHKSLAGSP